MGILLGRVYSRFEGFVEAIAPGVMESLFTYLESERGKACTSLRFIWKGLYIPHLPTGLTSLAKVIHEFKDFSRRIERDWKPVPKFRMEDHSFRYFHSLNTSRRPVPLKCVAWRQREEVRSCCQLYYYCQF